MKKTIKPGMSGKEMRPLVQAKRKKMTQAQDNTYDKKNKIKEGSVRDRVQDARSGIKDNKKAK